MKARGNSLRSRSTKPNTCTNCAKAIWDKRWGEYKCGYFHHRLQDPEGLKECPGFEKLKKGETVKNYETEEDEE